MKIDKKLYIMFLFFRLTSIIYSQSDANKKICIKNSINLDVYKSKMMYKVSKALTSQSFGTQLANQSVAKVVGANAKTSLTSLSGQINTLCSSIQMLQQNVAQLHNNIQTMTDRLVNLEQKIITLTDETHNAPVVILLSDINNSLNSSALQTDLVMYDSNLDTSSYNRCIKSALVLIKKVVCSPSKNNFVIAQNALYSAINAFDKILKNQVCNLSVYSQYSLNEIHIALIKLRFQLMYLCSYLYS